MIKMELGRSMVEMLGVLAIIGVLSIVGIAGYKKATLKHYANEAWNAAMQFNTIVQQRILVEPNEPCASNWYCSADSSVTSYAYCFLDIKEIQPSFSRDNYTKFYLFAHKHATEHRVNTIEFMNITINGLCKTILPEGTEVETGWLSQQVGDILYKCKPKSGVKF